MENFTKNYWKFYKNLRKILQTFVEKHYKNLFILQKCMDNFTKINGKF